MRNPYRERIRLAIEILGEVFGDPQVSRESVVETLRKTYEEEDVQPLRGKAFPEDIYDKEMATLYVVGKYGLGIDNDYPDEFERVFGREILLESALEAILQGDKEKAVSLLKKALGKDALDSNTVARMLRIAFTRLVLGYMDEEEFARILRATAEVLPEEVRTVRNFVRFYIAYKTAEEIARGSLRDKITKEAFKQALSARLGFEKVVPGDDYIRVVASEVFRIPARILDRVLKASHA